MEIFIVCFLLCFMCFIYEPIIMYSTNINDFWFDFHTMLLPTIKIFLVIFLILVILSYLWFIICKKVIKKEKIYNISLLCIFVIFFATYVQGNFLIGNLPLIDGSDINWNDYKIDNLLTIIIWTILIFTTIILSKKLSSNKTIKYCSYISFAIFGMLSISLISTLLSTDALKSKDNILFTENNFNKVSDNKNFIILLVDAVDSNTFYNFIENNDDYRKIFNDFTFFPDTMSTYPFTRDSIPLLLSGKINKNEEPFDIFSTNSLNSSPLFETLTEKDYEINLYDQELIWNDNRKYNVNNVISISESKVKLKSFFKQELKYILYKYLPYFLKNFSKIESLNFNFSSDNYDWRIDNNYKNINNENLKIVNNKQFKFIHTEGAHSPFDLNKNLNRISNGTYKEKVEANFKIIESYLNKLKENNVYDNSIIIILADHGYSENTILERMNPILFIKGFNEKHEMNISNLPISHVDLITTYKELLENKKSTELFKNIDYNRKRNFLYLSAKNPNHMIEYETEGKANDISKFKKTGNIFDR